MEAKFYVAVQSDPGAHPASCTMDTGFLSWGRWGANRQGLGVIHPPPYTTEIIEMVELYLYSLSEHSWAFLG